jgi:hypothetical protein
MGNNGPPAPQYPAYNYPFGFINGIYFNIVIIIDNVTGRRYQDSRYGQEKKPYIQKITDPGFSGANQKNTHKILGK